MANQNYIPVNQSNISQVKRVIKIEGRNKSKSGVGEVQIGDKIKNSAVNELKGPLSQIEIHWSLSHHELDFEETIFGA